MVLVLIPVPLLSLADHSISHPHIFHPVLPLSNPIHHQPSTRTTGAFPFFSKKGHHQSSDSPMHTKQLLEHFEFGRVLFSCLVGPLLLGCHYFSGTSQRSSPTKVFVSLFAESHSLGWNHGASETDFLRQQPWNWESKWS